MAKISKYLRTDASAWSENIAVPIVASSPRVTLARGLKMYVKMFFSVNWVGFQIYLLILEPVRVRTHIIYQTRLWK